MEQSLAMLLIVKTFMLDMDYFDTTEIMEARVKTHSLSTRGKDKAKKSWMMD